jgi:hypothetical protein
MLYLLVSWAIIGLLWYLFVAQAGMVAYNKKDLISLIFAGGPFVWILTLIIYFRKK